MTKRIEKFTIVDAAGNEKKKALWICPLAHTHSVERAKKKRAA